MAGVYDTLIGIFGDSSAMMLALVVFLATTIMAFGVMVAVHARGAVKRRAAGIEQLGAGADARALRRSSLKAVQRLLDYTTKHYSATEKDKGEMKVLRRRLIQAGLSVLFVVILLPVFVRLYTGHY